MLKIFLSVWFTLLAIPNLAYADTDLPKFDVIGCLKAVESLEAGYRGWMQQQCIGVAGDICVDMDKGNGSCLSDIVVSMRAYYGELIPLLPLTIEGSGFLVRSYERALERAAKTFKDVPDCSQLSGYEFTKCEYIQLGVATTDLFYRARLAKVSLP